MHDQRDHLPCYLSERGERLYGPPAGHFRRRGGDGGGVRPLCRARGGPGGDGTVGEPSGPRGPGGGSSGGAVYAHGGKRDIELSVLRGGQGRGARHRQRHRPALRGQQPDGAGGGAGGADQDQGHLPPAGPGDRGELPVPDGDAAADGVFVLQRPAPVPGAAAVPAVRRRGPGRGAGKSLPAGGRAVRGGLRRHGRDRPVHGYGRGQPQAGGGVGPLRADLQFK